MGDTLQGILAIRLTGGGLSGEKLASLNERIKGHGLVLSETDALRLAESRRNALADTGRVEVGPGITGSIVEAFAGSPYVSREDFAETVELLQTLFYRFRGEDEDVPDDDLVDAMRLAFDGLASGSIELLEEMDVSEMVSLLAGRTDEPEEGIDAEAPLPRPWNEDAWLDSFDSAGWEGERWEAEYGR
jgi:hypothetical protein